MDIGVCPPCGENFAIVNAILNTFQVVILAVIGIWTKQGNGLHPPSGHKSQDSHGP